MMIITNLEAMVGVISPPGWHKIVSPRCRQTSAGEHIDNDDENNTGEYEHDDDDGYCDQAAQH